MTEYPSIDPADVREGDVVEADYAKDSTIAYTVTGPAWLNSEGIWLVGKNPIYSAAAIRLISRPAPPEPPLRVGDWVRDGDGRERQIISLEGFGAYVRTTDFWARPANVTRIPPPVGWPVAVPDPDAPGGVRWYYRPPTTDLYYCESGGKGNWRSRSDLLAAGGIPALAPGGAA